MGDILKPQTPESNLETVRRRRIPTIGNASSSTVPASTPLSSVEEQQQQPPIPPTPAVVEQPVPDTQQLIPDTQQQQPVVDEGAEPGVPLQVEPAPPTLREQQVVPPVFAPPSSTTSPTEPGGGFQVEEPRQPDANFGDILTAPTLQPIYQSSAETQRRAQPEEMVEALQSIQVPNVQFANVPITGRNIITSRVEALREANAHIVRQNRGGLQDFTVSPGGGERIFKTSAIDNALAGTGLGSIIGTNLQDKLDPNREENTATGLLGWLQGVAKYSRSLIEQDRRNRIGGAGLEQIPGLAQGILGWLISSPLNTDITPEKRRENEAWEQEGWRKWRETGGLDQLTNNTVAETPTGQLTLEKYGTVFDPTRGYYGDAGKNPLLSPLIYLLNLPENILMGMVYDTADALGFDKSKSWDNRSRTLGALNGRDWGVSNRWSEERYISLQEPAGQVAGQRTGNPYWDLPENIAKTFGADESGGVSKNLHIALQTIPAMLGEVITGGVSDLGVDNILKLPSRATDVASLGRRVDELEAVLPDNLDIPGVRRGGEEVVVKTPVVSENSIEVPTQNIDPVGNPVVVKVETQPVIPETTPKTEVPLSEVPTPSNPPKVELGDGQVVQVKDIPSGRRVSDNVVEGITIPKVEVPPSTESLVRRPLSELEGTELARRQGIIEPEFKRTLSEGELAELARQQGRLFDGQTTIHPDFTRASYVTLDDGTIRKVVLSPTDANSSSRVLIKETLPTVDELVEINSSLDDLAKQFSVVPEAAKLSELVGTQQRALLRHAAEPAESAYTTRLLEDALPSTQESFSTTAKIVGNDMVNIERALTSQRVVIDQLIQEVDEIKAVRNQLEEVAPTIKPVGRQSIDDALGTFEEYSGQAVPEMGFRVPEAEQYADLVGSGFNPVARPNSTTDDWIVGKFPPTEFAKKNSEMTLWFHGTSSSVPIQELDILKGATPSEYGLGVYLTKNEAVANQAALALPQINRPPRPESIDLTPVRYTVDTSRVTRLFDLDAPMPKDIDELFYQTTVSIFGKNVADDAFRKSTTNVKLRQAWDTVRDSVYNVAGTPASEKQIREFQQVILEGFKELDVQAGLLKGGDNVVLVVYNPKLLTPSGVPEKLPTPPFIKQYEARSWLDKLTRNIEPSNSNIHNALQSNLDYAEQATREAAESLAIELNKQKEMLEDYIVKRDELETVVRKEQKETVRQLEATGDTVEAVQSVMRNDLVESAKTRRQRARQTSEAKDYSVPKNKRGKNPPAVSDKPVSSDALPRRSSSRFGDVINTLEDNQAAEQNNLVSLLTVATRIEPDNKDFQRALELAKQGKTVDLPPTKPRKLRDIISDLEQSQVEGIKVDAQMYGKVAEAYVKKYGYNTDDLSNALPDARVSGKKSLEASGQTDLSETLKQQTPEAVPVEVVVEPIGVPLEGKRIPLENRAASSSVGVPTFKVKAGTQLKDVEDWKAAGQTGVYKFGDKTEFINKYGRTEEAMDRFALDAGGASGVELNYVENTFANQKNFQNILDGKNPSFDSRPFPEWVPSTGEMTDYYDWTDYAKQYTNEKYTINRELTTPSVSKSKGGVAGFKGEFVDLGSGKTFADRQDEYLIKYSGADAPSEMIENTHWNLESFKRVKQGKKPIGNPNANPATEWVPSTGKLKAYKDWDDYADQYSVAKYTPNSTAAPVSPKMKVAGSKQDRMVDNLLKDWDDIDLGDVRSADKQAKKFTVPELEDPCL